VGEGGHEEKLSPQKSDGGAMRGAIFQESDVEFRIVCLKMV
jgi:hypothetical protein